MIGARDAASVNLASRTRAEAQAAGFVVVPNGVVGIPETATDLLVQRVERASAHALVLLSAGDPAQVTVVVLDPVSGGAYLRRTDRQGHGDDSSVAMQAVELLRATWLETGLVDVRGGVATAAPMDRSDAGRLEAASLGLMTGVVYSPGGVTPTWTLGGRFTVYRRPWLGAAFGAAGTPVAASVRSDSSLSLRRASMALGPVFRVRPTSRTYVWLTPALGATCVRGSLSDGGVESRWAPELTLGVGTGQALSRHLMLRLDLDLHSLAGPLRVDVDGREVAHFGVPVVDATLGLEVRLR